MAAVQSLPPLRPPRVDALYRTVERWIDASIHTALSPATLTQHQHLRTQLLLQRWKQRVMLEVSAIVDERGLLDLLSQIDQLVARSSGQLDDSTPVISLATPEEQLRDELLVAYEEERERLTAVAQQLEVANKLLQADVSNRRQQVDECRREIHATVELVKQAKLLTMGMGDEQPGSD